MFLPSKQTKMPKGSKLIVDSLLTVLLLAILILPISSIGLLSMSGVKNDANVLGTQSEGTNSYIENTRTKNSYLEVRESSETTQTSESTF